MKIYFGLDPKAKWPDIGMGSLSLPAVKSSTAVQRFEVVAYVRARVQGARFQLRCMAVCPSCDAHVSFSRLPQHYRIHE